MRNFILPIVSLMFLVGCTTSQPQGAQPRNANLITVFTNVSDSQFRVQAIAPPNAVRELAICKAVWLAEKKHAPRLSMGNPAYSAPTNVPAYLGKVPEDWVMVTATVYLTDPNPDKNQIVSVAEKAVACRAAWEWYR